MRVLLSTRGPRVDVETMALAAQRAAPGAPVEPYAPPDHETAEAGDAPVAIGVMPTGGWR